LGVGRKWRGKRECGVGSGSIEDVGGGEIGFREEEGRERNELKGEG